MWLLVADNYKSVQDNDKYAVIEHTDLMPNMSITVLAVSDEDKLSFTDVMAIINKFKPKG